jgi:hypothetical protein
MVKTKTYAPPKGGVGTNKVELSEESDVDLLDQHDSTENEHIVLTEVSDNELPDETVVLRSILPDDAPSINTIPPLSNGPRRSLRLRKKSQANQPKGKALPTLELNGESKGDSNAGSKGDSTGIYGMLKGAMQDMDDDPHCVGIVSVSPDWWLHCQCLTHQSFRLGVLSHLTHFLRRGTFFVSDPIFYFSILVVLWV